MKITDEAFNAANRRAAAKKAAFPAVVSVRYDRRVSRVVITLASGLELAFSPEHAQGLEHAHPADLMDAEITPSGLGIHFPKLDADLYIPTLLEGFLGSKRWMAAENVSCSALCGAPHKADYADRSIMWSYHGELSRKPCTERLFQSNWLHEVVIISGV